MQIPMEKWSFCIKCEYMTDDDEALYCCKKGRCYQGGCDQDMAVRSPISRVGGKFYLAGKIVRLLPEHRIYVEPFGGAMHVLFKKEPSDIEIYNDIDSGLVNFFNVVKFESEAFFKQLEFSLYSREVFLNALRTMNDGTDAERACKFFIVNRQCFGGKVESWSINSKGVGHFFGYEQRIRAAHERIKTVFIENLDWRKIISKYDGAETLFYIDPPYMFNGVRGKTKLYENEMSDKDHKELVETLKNIKGKFLLSGYENGLYDVFERVTLGESNMCVNKIVGGGRVKRMEFVWGNF